MRNLMLSRLTRPMMRLLGRDERGAVGVLVAILMGGGVLVGMGALVIDVGTLYQNRAELQNGADAGALAVARTCVATNCTPSVATFYADANAKSGVAGVDLVCGSSGLGNCPVSTGKITDCPAAPPAGTDYVDVHTESMTASGSSLVPPIFAQTLLGNKNYKGSTVFACARAEWGAPSTATATAITIANCEWSAATNDGSSFASSPPSASDDVVLSLSGTASGSDGCSTFNWTTDGGSSCSSTFSGGFDAYSSAGVPPGCASVLTTSQTTKTVILVPIFVQSSGCGQGKDGSYTAQGFAAFVVTGYNLTDSSGPAFTAKDWLTNRDDPTDSISGYFTKAFIPASGTIGGTDMGASIIQLTG